MAPATSPPWLRAALDGAGTITLAVFVAWVAFRPFPSSWDEALDYGLFSAIAFVATGWQFVAGVATRSPRERLAWRLLGVASLARMLSGHVWTWWLITHASESRPIWLQGISAISPVLSIASLLAFTSEPRGAMDRKRLALDAAIVLVGSALMMRAVVDGPFLESDGSVQAILDDYVEAIVGALSAAIAAVVYLRASTAYLRAVALLLLLAFLLQAVPDVLFAWRGSASAYRHGDALSVIWFSAWAVKGLAGRYASRRLERQDRPIFEPFSEYQGGPLPYVFFGVSGGVVLMKLIAIEQTTIFPYVVGAFALATLLVTREQVELVERARLQRTLAKEESRFGALLRDAYDFLLLVAPSGHVVFASPVTQRLLSARAAPDTPWGFLEAGLPEDRAGLRANIETPRGSSSAIRFRVPLADREAEFLLTVDDRRSDARIGAVIVSGSDRSRETQLRRRLQHAEETEAIGVFAGGLAHDFNNILTAINGHAEMLREDLPEDSPNHQDLEGVFAATSRARRLTSGFLALSRRKDAPRRRVAISALLAARTGNAGSAVQVQIHDSLGDASTDTDLDALVIGVDAVVRAAAEGGGVVRVRQVEIVDDEAAALGVTAGAFAVIEADAGDHEVATARGTSNDLDVLMAIAAVREVGGAFIPGTSSGATRILVPVDGP